MTLAVAVDNSEREEPVRRKMPLRGVTLDKAMQPREKIDGPTVDRYAELLLEGVVMPAVILVYDGETFWLADGYHRVLSHEKAGLPEIEAEIHYGSKLDAVRIALRANADHGKPRSDKDLRRAYRLAVQHDLVDGGDVDGLAKLIACTDRWARELTKDVREAREAELRQKMHELKEQGFSIRKIAEALGVTKGVVQHYFDSLKPAKSDGVPERNNSELVQPKEPSAAVDDLEQVEMFAPVETGAPEAPAEPEPQAELASEPEADAEPSPADDARPQPAAEVDPLAEYNEQWKRETPQREMWGQALAVLQEFAKLPAPEVLFANRYQRFDYLFKPALDNAWNWLEAFEEKWHGAQDR
jgi:hypothetical protein